MSSDEEDNVRTAFKKAAVSTAPQETANNTTHSNHRAKPLAGMAIVFTGDFECEREHLMDVTKKNGG
jgi:NAD-dependent DNA ligase